MELYGITGIIGLHGMAVLAGCVLDFCFGDPHGLWHPVCGIGSMISFFEKEIRKRCPDSEKSLFKGGIALVFLVLFFTGAAVRLFLQASDVFFGSTGVFLAESVLSYYLLAARSLRDESMKVYEALKDGDTERARRAVSMIVGRDTKPLSEEGIVKAAVETVAENTSDGVIAPLFFLVFGGVTAGWLYKAVNTMDSMVGYRNERYLYFGRAAAKLDDVLNWIPSRISAMLMILASFLLRMDWKNAVKIYKRDRKNHKSPNSAQTEAVCAGALGLELAGDAWYFGMLVKKPTIGDGLRPAEYEDIKRADALMETTFLISILLFIIL